MLNNASKKNIIININEKYESFNSYGFIKINNHRIGELK